MPRRTTTPLIAAPQSRHSTVECGSEADDARKPDCWLGQSGATGKPSSTIDAAVRRSGALTEHLGRERTQVQAQMVVGRVVQVRRVSERRRERDANANAAEHSSPPHG